MVRFLQRSVPSLLSTIDCCFNCFFVVGVPDSDDEVDGMTAKELEDAKLKKEEEELTKIASGIGKVFLKNVQEREKFKQWKAANLDPRNASR